MINEHDDRLTMVDRLRCRYATGPMVNALALIRARFHCDPADFEASLLNGIWTYQTANQALNDGGDLFASPAKPVDEPT